MIFNQKDEVRMQYLFMEMVLLPKRILQNPKLLLGTRVVIGRLNMYWSKCYLGHLFYKKWN